MGQKQSEHSQLEHLSEQFAHWQVLWLHVEQLQSSPQVQVA